MNLVILIAEDEYFTRKSLVKLVSNYVSEVPLDIHEAENCTDALSVLRRLDTAVDIALLDIRMNGEESFDLLRAIKEQNPNLLAAFISGYREFNYAQEAVRLGVQNYLLKPVIRADLYAMLDIMIEACIQQIRGQLRTLLQRHCPISEYANKSFVSWFDQGYIPLLVYFKQRFSVENNIAFQRILRELGLRNYLIVDLVYRMHPVFYAVFFPIRGSDANAQNRRVAQMIPKINESIRLLSAGNPELATFSLAHDNVCTGIDTLLETFNCLMFRARQESAGISTTHENPSRHKHILYAFEQKLRDCILSGNYANIEKDFRDNMGACLSDPAFIARLITILNDAAYHVAKQDRTNTFYELMTEDVCGIRDPEEIRSVLLQYIYKICNCVNSEDLSVQNQLVESIKAYLDKHYQEDIIIKDLARNVFFIHSKYMSSIFSKLEGITISDYILERRMMRARHLLRHTSKSITEIASEVGYNNLSYFIHKFKKCYGFTPSKTDRQ